MQYLQQKNDCWNWILLILGTVAFQADLDIYTSIPIGSVVVFDVVHLNIGGGWVHLYQKENYVFLTWDNDYN